MQNREEDLVVKPRHPVKTFFRFFAMIKPYWSLMTLRIAFDFILNPVPIALGIMGAWVIDNVLLNKAAPTDERIQTFIIMTLIISLIEGVRVMIQGGFFEGPALLHFYGDIIGSRIRLSLRRKLYLHLHRLPMSFFQKRPIGEHAYRMLADTGPGGFGGPDVVGLATGTVPELVSIGNKTIIAAGYLAYATPEIAVLVLCYLVPKIFFLHYLTSLVQRQSFLQRARDQEVQGVIRDSIDGAATVRCFGQQKREMRRYTAAVARAWKRGVSVNWTNTIRDNIHNLLDLSFGTALYAFVIWKTIEGQYTVGTFLLILGIVRGIPEPLLAAVNMIQGIRLNLVLGERILQTLDVKADNVDKPSAVRLRKIEGRIEMEHVKFSYPDGTQVLRDVNLTIEPGQSLAIVGPSGQGKSTLFYLLLRILRPDSGSVRIDGIDLNDLRIGDFTKQCGTVTQETHLFIGSIKQNLKYPWPTAKQADIEEAARIADIHEFILTLPEGYDTDVREGHRMSGGQRQRIGIARALVGRPPILLFDEPTSSLDPRTEDEVWKAMQNAMQGRTSLVVTHRLTTARTADRIAVLNNGVIAEIGTHEELLLQNGLYARMWNQQFHAKEDAAG